VEILRPRWSSATFLLYAGGLTVLVATGSALQYLSSQYGKAAFAGWALLVLVVLEGIAAAKRGRTPITAGLFAFISAIAFTVFVGALWSWFGWLHASTSLFHGFHVSLLALWLLSLWFAAGLRRVFRFPLLTLLVYGWSWIFVTDFLSNGGDWSATVTLVFGLVLLVSAAVVDGGDRRPYGFWMHVVAGLTVGGALLFWWHSGNWHFALVAIAGVVFVGIAAATGRSSWAVFGSIGIGLAAGHYIVEWWRHGLPYLSSGGAPRGWVPPVGLAVLGAVYLALGLGLNRRARG
jgi:hypothetical protein